MRVEAIPIDAGLVDRARIAGIDVAAACHAALELALTEAAQATLRAETAGAIAEWNDWAGAPPER